MRKTRSIAFLFLATISVSCGTKEKRSAAPSTTEELPKIPVEHAPPKTIMVRIPLENGQAQLDKATTVTFDNEVHLTADSDMAGIFSQGEAVDMGNKISSVKGDDEAESSSQQFYWGNGYAYGGGFGSPYAGATFAGAGIGIGAILNGITGIIFASKSPNFNWGGGSYPYGPGQYYNQGPGMYGPGAPGMYGPGQGPGMYGPGAGPGIYGQTAMYGAYQFPNNFLRI